MRFKRLCLRLLLLVVLGLTVGCFSPAGPVGEGGGPEAAPGSAELTIECHVFYRASPSESLSEDSPLTFTSGGDQGRVLFDDLAFQATYNDDEFEGRSFLISVEDPGSGDQVVRQLYQIDRGEKLENQFVGGHGFTGLAYVYHRASGAEMQYFCQAR